MASNLAWYSIMVISSPMHSMHNPIIAFSLTFIAEWLLSYTHTTNEYTIKFYLILSLTYASRKFSPLHPKTENFGGICFYETKLNERSDMFMAHYVYLHERKIVILEK